MPMLKDMLQPFSAPAHTPEEWEQIERRVDNWEQRQALIATSVRIDSSGIPTGFIGAELTNCDKRIADWVEVPTIGLLLQGEPGRGKTYAACAALMEFAKVISVRFVTMDDLLRECRAAFSGRESEQSIIDRYASAGVLCLDDVGKERLTEWSLPIFFTIIDRRHKSGKRTIITTNHQGVSLMDKFTVGGDVTTAKAIISRMASYTRIVLEGDDRRLAR